MNIFCKRKFSLLDLSQKGFNKVNKKLIEVLLSFKFSVSMTLTHILYN